MITPVIIGATLSENTSLIAVISILYVAVSVFMYYIIRSRELVARLIGSEKPDSLHVFFLVKIAGLIIFGIIPFIVLILSTGLKVQGELLTPGSSGQYWYILPVVFFVITFLSYSTSRKKNNAINRPSDKLKSATPKYGFVTISGWVLYILGYEYLFRGILWISCYEAFGFWVAFTINVILYVLAHTDQGYFMTLGAFPFGILLCYLTFLTGSFLFAFLVHSWLAVNNLMFPVYTGSDRSVGIKMKSTGV